jgi:hypothetical protein
MTSAEREKSMHNVLRRFASLAMTHFLVLWSVITAQGYAFNQIVPDVRQPGSISGGSACPIPSHQRTSPAAIAFRWSTMLGTNPKTILTQNQTASGSLNEIEQVIQQSLSIWSSVAGTTLTAVSIAPLVRSSTANLCGSDGIHSICFDQPDMAFTPGVLAFTRVITADQIGIQLGSGAPSTQVGQILAANPKSYDLESLLTHELGHALGFSHSAVWSAMMFPFAPAPGTFTGMRPTTQQPDAPLADDDRTGLRVLYHNPADTQFVGSIQGRIIPANALSLPASPPGVTGIFGAHVVAVDAASGAVTAGTLGGWSCQAAGPAQFDGTYQIGALAVNHTYKIYAEPLNGAVGPAEVSNAMVSLCRNTTTDPGWPPLQSCVVPNPNLEFTTVTRSSP